MAFSDFLARFGGGGGMSRAPSADMVIAGAEQVVEVGLATGVVGALEQRFGEEKTTLFMSDQVDSSGNVIKDDKGNPLKKSGTGMPMSAAGALGGIALSALLPMSPSWRRRLLNVSAGFGAAWTYRKGIEMGQKWLDSKQPPAADGSTPKTDKPEPPFAQSLSAKAEIANVKGETDADNVYSLAEECNRILSQRNKTASGR